MKSTALQKAATRLFVLWSLLAVLLGSAWTGQTAWAVIYIDEPTGTTAALLAEPTDTTADLADSTDTTAALLAEPTDTTAALLAEPTDTTADLAETSTSSLADRLAALDGVIYVTQLDAAYGYDQVYELVFEQPISYDDPSAGTFQQHAILYYSGDADVTIVNTSGYYLSAPSAALKFGEQYHAGNANILNLEYRFFGESAPAGLDKDSTDLWEYLTAENAATDFHRIVQSTSSVLTGKRLWTGGSKGGFTTNYQCYFQEKNGYHDADAFVAWVAPLCDGAADSRFAEAVYTTIGDDLYGEETAQTYRDLVLQFQLQCVKYRDTLQQRFYNAAIVEGDKFREEYFTSDPAVAAARVWDVAISEFAVSMWQYHLDWSAIEQTLAIEDESQRIEAIYQMMVDYVGYSDAAYNTAAFPYYVQSATEMGNYTVDLTYLRAAVAEEQAKDPSFPGIELPQSLEGSFSNLFFTDEQLTAFTYSSDTRDALLDWAQTTTTAHIIMVDGAADTWRNVSMPDVENSTIHRYLAANCHTSRVSDLTEADQTELWSLLSTWLAPDSEPETTPGSRISTTVVTTSASSGTTSTSSGAASTSASSTAKTGDPLAPCVLILCVLASLSSLVLARAAARRRSATLVD